MTLFHKTLPVFILIICTLLTNPTLKAQTTPKITKKAKHLLGELVWVPSGKSSFTERQDFGTLTAVSQLIQGHEDFDKYATSKQIPAKVDRIKGFMMMSTEVTNLQWKKFYEAMRSKLGEAKAKMYLPDTSTWQNDVPNVKNDPLVEHYFQHPAFGNFPVVGVSWEQAQAYCQWLTDEVNALQAKKGLTQLPAFRLPTEAEWEYAAIQGQQNNNRILATSSGYLTDTDGKIQVNCGAVYDKNNTKTFNYSDDGFAYTNSVKSYKPNMIGLYGMSGNVAEWVSDNYNTEGNVKVCKGGSWITSTSHLYCDARLGVKKEAQHSFIGFRVVLPLEYPQ